MLCAGAFGAAAQTKPGQSTAGFPSKPLRIVVPYPPGGGLDILARMISQPLGERWGIPVIVDNRPGASGMVGTQIVAKAFADGYTLAMVSTEFITAPLVYKRHLYDTIADFTGVIQTASLSYLLVVHPSLPVQSVRDLITYAKARSGQFNFTSAGMGGVGHLSGELLKRSTGIEMTYVNYKGTGPALTDTIAGQIQVMFVNPLPAIPHIRTGRLRLLASTDAKRIPSMPDVPTIAESGVTDFSTSGWNGLIAPAGTPKSVIRILNEAVGAVVAQNIERITRGGAEPAGGTPEAFSALMLKDHGRWSDIIRTMKIGGE